MACSSVTLPILSCLSRLATSQAKLFRIVGQWLPTPLTGAQDNPCRRILMQGAVTLAPIAPWLRADGTQVWLFPIPYCSRTQGCTTRRTPFFRAFVTFSTATLARLHLYWRIHPYWPGVFPVHIVVARQAQRDPIGGITSQCGIGTPGFDVMHFKAHVRHTTVLTRIVIPRQDSLDKSTICRRLILPATLGPMASLPIRGVLPPARLTRTCNSTKLALPRQICWANRKDASTLRAGQGQMCGSIASTGATQRTFTSNRRLAQATGKDFGWMRGFAALAAKSRCASFELRAAWASIL